MSEEEINNAIAEIRGWKLRWQNKGGGGLLTEKPAGHCWKVWIPPQDWYKSEQAKRLRGPGESYHGECSPPNYCRDLNAMHELESLYIEMEGWWTSYLGHIEEQWSKVHQAHAPAYQRALAFLRTFRKWKEKK